LTLVFGLDIFFLNGGSDKMPKKIENIEQKILDSATNLFQSQGFDQTDMKMIAQEAGTGVGNIYNYYENKPKLFMEVGRNWRKRLVRDLEQILAEDLPARERVTKLLIALYENVERWSGIWMEFMMKNQKVVFGKLGAEIKEEYEKEEEKLAKQLQLVLYDAMNGNSRAQEILKADDGRFATLMFMSIFMLPSRYPGQPEANLKFIHRYVDFFFSTR
jgi:AcrR family transcriptional regulator